MARYWDDKQTILGFGIPFKTNIGNCSAKPMLGNEIGNCINTDVKAQLWYSIIFPVIVVARISWSVIYNKLIQYI